MPPKQKAKFRKSKDSMGQMLIPADMLYGASTQRAVLNFPVSGYRMSRAFLKALGQLKVSCAKANLKLKCLPTKQVGPIVKAASAVRDGAYDKHFVVDVFQTGSGTSTNMNANEVIANLANRKFKGKRIHPNDHVNKGQSSNDIIPTTIHISSVLEIQQELIPSLGALAKALAKKEKQFAKVYKIGRTHLQDATPMTLGQEFGGYAEQMRKGIVRLNACLIHLRELPIGGTAIGTGINTHKRFAKEVCRDLNTALKTQFREAKNHFEAQAAKDACVEASGVMKTIAVSLMKIANDIRWLGCGPRAGISEILVPAVQPGSSIMPGKVNPVIAESVTQVAAQVIGNDATITIAGQSGNFELNVMMPLIAHNLLEQIRLLANVSGVFRTQCIDGLQADKKKCESQIETSLMLSTPLVPVLGYDKAAALAKEAFKAGLTIREVVLKHQLLSEKDLRRILAVNNLV
ncbi:MAG: fumarate hydratase class II [Candidatus Omnitrophota bacterium]|jgi:fumarate hydratase class II